MNLAVIGSGGREHAICYKLRQSLKVKKIICIPGNAGTQKIAENVNEALRKKKFLKSLVRIRKILVLLKAKLLFLLNELKAYLVT